MTVWIVTTGSYSDYSVHSVWSTEELAKRMEAILLRGYRNDANHFSIEVDSPCKENAGVSVSINLTTGEKDDLPVEEVTIETPEVDFYDYVSEGEIVKDSYGRFVVKDINGEDVEVFVEAKNFTERKALKSARDFRAQFLARRAGIA